MMIEYKESTHEYFLDGVKLNSVTQIINKAGLTDFSNIPPEVLGRAAKFGSAVHTLTELIDNNDLDVESVDPALIPYHEGWHKFLKETGFKPLEIEQIVYSKKYRFAGRYDRKGTLNDKLTLLDIKTGTINKRAIRITAIQTAGYSIAHDEGKKAKEKIKQRVAVWLKADGDYKIEVFKDKSNYAEFMACITVANIKEGLK